MTADDARIVAKIGLEAHEACSDCGGRQLEALYRAYPEHRDVFENVWAERWPKYVPLIRPGDEAS